MGFVYHANYFVWLDMARTEHLRDAGMTYRAMEASGVFLTVTDARIRYRRAARYDDLVRVRCWVRELASRRVTFGYAVERSATDTESAGTESAGDLLATAETALIALDRNRQVSRIPAAVQDLLATAPDPVRL